MINNRITDLLCRIRNSLHRDGFIISSKDLLSSDLLYLLAKLASLGLVKFNPETSAWYLTRSANYFHLGHIRHISSSGRRIFRPWSLIQEGEIIRTSIGFLTRAEAFKYRIGGELVLKYTLASPNRT